MIKDPTADRKQAAEEVMKAYEELCEAADLYEPES